jgi:hypothetical protein
MIVCTFQYPMCLCVITLLRVYTVVCVPYVCMLLSGRVVIVYPIVYGVPYARVILVSTLQYLMPMCPLCSIQCACVCVPYVHAAIRQGRDCVPCCV